MHERGIHGRLGPIPRFVPPLLALGTGQLRKPQRLDRREPCKHGLDRQMRVLPPSAAAAVGKGWTIPGPATATLPSAVRAIAGSTALPEPLPGTAPSLRLVAGTAAASVPPPGMVPSSRDDGLPSTSEPAQPDEIVEPLRIAVLLAATRSPSLTVVPPVYVFAPERVTVPPVFFSTLPGPASPALIVPL